MDIEGWWRIKCLVIKHVGGAHTLEVCTTNTFDIGDQHNDDGSHVRSLLLYPSQWIRYCNCHFNNLELTISFISYIHTLKYTKLKV
jgi:hypothetical protein